MNFHHPREANHTERSLLLKRYKYLLSKVLWASLSIIFVMILNFFLFRVLPGDPARAGVKDPRLTAEAQNAIRIRFGLDKPVINCFESINPLKLGSCLVNPLDTQFFIYVRNLLQGDLGTSYHTNRPVKDMIGEGLVNTIILIGFGQMIAIFLGMALGLIAAWKANTVIDFATLRILPCCLVAANLLAGDRPAFCRLHLAGAAGCRQIHSRRWTGDRAADDPGCWQTPDPANPDPQCDHAG